MASEKAVLQEQLLALVEENQGEVAACLLRAQLAYADTLVTAKERKHFEQQHVYQLMADWRACANPDEPAKLDALLPWLKLQTQSPFVWPE